MKTVFLSLTVAVSLVSGLSAFAAPNQVQDKALNPALHRIEENCKLVDEYAPIYEWDNVNNEVDRIVAAEKKAQKALEGMPELKKQAEDLHLAVKALRSARLNHDPDRAVAAANKVNDIARELMK